MERDSSFKTSGEKKKKQNENILFKATDSNTVFFAVATEAATATAKQNRLMTLAIPLDMLMRSVFGENEGFQQKPRGKLEAERSAGRPRGGKGTKNV